MAYPYKILLISLHKIGDNLQAAASLPVLAANHPNSQITVLSESPFDFPFREHKNVNELVLFDRKVHFDKHNSPFLNELRDRKFNLIVNRHSSEEGAFIAGFIGADEIRGYFLKADGSGWVLDPWSRLLFAACRNRNVNPFNFVDYSINIAGRWDSNRSLSLFFDMGAADNIINEIGGNSSPIVAVQVASNAERRQWGAERFGLAVAKVLSSIKDVRFAFIGTEKEQHFAQKAIAEIPSVYSNRVFDLSGKISMEMLPDFLQRSTMLLTNDTGPMHIAAAVNCPVIAIYAGESFLNETGPYAPNNWIIHADIECLPCLTNVPCSKDYICKKMVTPEAVAEYVSAKISGREKIKEFDGVALYHSGTRLLRDEIRYRPLVKRKFSQNDFLRYAFYVSFQEKLNGNFTDLSLLAHEIVTSWTDIETVVSTITDFPTTFIDQFALQSEERNSMIQIMKKNVSELKKLLS
jgi:ADP-heptose:LPS heptosyltransferase